MSYIHMRLQKKDRDGTTGEGALDDFANEIKNQIVSLGGIVTAIPLTQGLCIDGKVNMYFIGNTSFPTYINVSAETVGGVSLFSGKRFRVCSGLGTDYGFSCGIKAAANENSFALTLRNDRLFPYVNGAYTESPNFDMNFFYGKCADGTSVFYGTGFNTNTSPSTQDFAINSQMFDMGGLQLYTLPSRLPYVAKADITEIDAIADKLIVKDGIKYSSISKVYDASTVTGDMFYPVGNKIYYAINNNTLMEV